MSLDTQEESQDQQLPQNDPCSVAGCVPRSSYRALIYLRFKTY